MKNNGRTYHCKKCMEKISSQDKFCLSCKGNLSKVGRYICLSCSDQVSAKETLKIQQKRKRFKRFVKEIIQGYKPSKNPKLSEGVDYSRTIDRENDEYHHVVKDNITGDIIHKEYESLRNHK